MHLVVLTGASAAGKTTIADAIGSRYRDLVDVYGFDEIGVPSASAMIEGWGSGELWQHAMTLEWMKRIASNLRLTPRPILFEGQMRIASIEQALGSAGMCNAQTILVDCDDTSRARRLIQERKQPELAGPRMMNWADYLRREAQAADVEILDTGCMPLRKCVQAVATHLGLRRP